LEREVLVDPFTKLERVDMIATEVFEFLVGKFSKEDLNTLTASVSRVFVFFMSRLEVKPGKAPSYEAALDEMLEHLKAAIIEARETREPEVVH
jgi:hypothetical protein